MGIIALVLGIIALPISFIPCVGNFAIPPAALAIIFGIVGLVQAKNGNGKNGLPIAGLVVGIVAVVCVVFWDVFIGEKAKEIQQDTTFMIQMDSIMQEMDSVKMDSTVMK